MDSPCNRSPANQRATATAASERFVRQVAKSADEGGAGATGFGVAVEADDESAGGLMAGCAVAAGRVAGDVTGVAGFEEVRLALAAKLDGAFEDVDHLDAGIAVGVEAGVVLAGKEIGEAGGEG